MDIESLRQYCLQKKGVEEGMPFGPDALVFKVGGKMFAILALENEPLSISLKGKPEDNLILREQYTWIRPGYHLNKQHWNTLDLGIEAELKLVHKCIDESYQLVFNALSKKIKSEIL